MAYIHIKFENPGHKIQAKNAISEAYRHIPHRFETNTKNSITLLADTSTGIDKTILEKIRLLNNNSDIQIIPLHEMQERMGLTARKALEGYNGDYSKLEKSLEDLRGQNQILESKMVELEGKLSEEKSNVEQWEKYASETEERLTQDKEGAERRIRELVDALRDAKKATGDSQGDYRTLLGQYTTLREELQRTASEGSASVARVRTLEQNLSGISKEMGTLRRRYETIRPVEDLITQWIESHSTIYECLAGLIQQLGETFDPSLTVEELVAKEAEKQGLSLDTSASKTPDFSWEETEYHTTHGKDYQDKKEELALLDQHELAIREGKKEDSPIEKLRLPEVPKELLVKSMRERREGNIQYIHEYEVTRSSYLTSLQESRRSRTAIDGLQKEIAERRSQQERTLEEIAEKVSENQKAIPIFLIQKEEDTAYTLRAVLPVSAKTRESLSDAIRYFHNLLSVVALRHEPEGAQWEDMDQDTLVTYALSCPKEHWTRNNMQVLRENICDAMRAESRRYPLFNAGYRVQPVTFEIDNRMAVKSSEPRDSQTAWRQISPYLQNQILEILKRHTDGLRQMELQTILEGNPAVVSHLRSLGCAQIESWRIHNAVTSLKNAGTVERITPTVQGKKKFSIFKISTTPRSSPEPANDGNSNDPQNT